jgi:CubicO group peptidase (beta-lactamase class C family)
MKYLIAIIILYISVGCSKKIDSNQIQRIDGSSISIAKLDARIKTLVDTANVTGLTVTIFNQDTIAYQKAFGYSNYTSKDSLKINHVFSGASFK